MILADTDILSLFAKVNRLGLLFQVFDEEILHFAQSVLTEIQRGADLGFVFANGIIKLHEQGKLKRLSSTGEYRLLMATLPHTLDDGERESIAICKRLGATFVSNERRVKHHCRENKILCVNLNEILRALWQLHILTQAEVRELMKEIELKDNLSFKAIDAIFADGESE